MAIKKKVSEKMAMAKKEVMKGKSPAKMAASKSPLKMNCGSPAKMKDAKSPAKMNYKSPAKMKKC